MKIGWGRRSNKEGQRGGGILLEMRLRVTQTKWTLAPSMPRIQAMGFSAFLFSWFGGERFCHLDELRLVDSWLVCGPVNDFCFRTWAAAPPKSILACIPLGFNIA